jgi:hypothetical protein
MTQDQSFGHSLLYLVTTNLAWAVVLCRLEQLQLSERSAGLSKGISIRTVKAHLYRESEARSRSVKTSYAWGGRDWSTRHKDRSGGLVHLLLTHW